MLNLSAVKDKKICYQFWKLFSTSFSYDLTIHNDENNFINYLLIWKTLSYFCLPVNKYFIWYLKCNKTEDGGSWMLCLGILETVSLTLCDECLTLWILIKHIKQVQWNLSFLRRCKTQMSYYKKDVIDINVSFSWIMISSLMEKQVRAGRVWVLAKVTWL